MEIIQTIIFCFIAAVVYYVRQDWIADNEKHRMRAYRRRKKEIKNKEKIIHSSQKTSDVQTTQLKILCLDRSGSMSSFGKEFKSGVDTYLNELVNIQGNNVTTYWSVVTFDDIIEHPIGEYGQVLCKYSQLRSEWIKPRGSTALHDGILAACETADKMLLYNHCNSEVEIIVFTDGQENSSSRINERQLNSLIKMKKKLGWTFTFLAANQDAVATGSSYGFDAGRSMTSSAGCQEFCWGQLAKTPVKERFSKAQRAGSVSHNDRRFLSNI